MARRCLRPLIALVLACGCLLASSCGGVNPLASVVTRTSSTQGARIDMRVELTLPGAGPISLTGNGVMDLAGSRGRMSMRSEGPLPGLGSKFRMDQVIDRRVLYMRIRGVPQATFGGKEWLKVDIDKVAAGAGFNLGALESAGSGDPAQTLRWLSAANDVTKLAPELVRGIRTDHYSAEIDLDDVADNLPSAERERAHKGIEQLRRFGVPERVPTEVWVGGDGLLRRQTVTYEATLPGVGPMKMRSTIDLYDYGTAARIRRPDPDDVFNLTDLAAAAVPKVGP